MRSERIVYEALKIAGEFSVNAPAAAAAAIARGVIHHYQRYKILKEANRWMNVPYKWGGQSRVGVDCSHFVWQVYRNSFPSFKYHITSTFVSSQVVPVKTPVAGDFILWPHHVGIVVDPARGTFIAANGGIDANNHNHGRVRCANYKTDRWVKSLGRSRFFRYINLQ